MAGKLEGIKRPIKALNQRVAEATLSPVVWPETPHVAVRVLLLLPTDLVVRDAGRAMDAEKQLDPIRKKVMFYEGLCTPGITGSCNTPQSVNFGSLPMPSGAVS